MTSENDDRLIRLSDAVTAFLRFQEEGGADPEAFLHENEDLRELLAPMLAEAGADVTRPSDDREAGLVAPLPAAGRRIDDFRIVRELGRGGMGVVYEAHQISLKRTVALKVLPPSLGLGTTRIERFRREAAAAARLNHPGILPVYCVGEADGTHFFAMELVDGPSLHDVLDEARARGGGGLGVFESLSRVAEVVELVAQVADGLAAAHEAGVIHRDIKPHNILIDRGRRGSRDGTRSGPRQCVRIVDFGLAKDLDQATVSRSGEVAGTPQYMSPEQVAGLRAVDERTDVFSLGVVMYECLTLAAPFAGETTQRVLHAVVHHEPAPLRAMIPGLPADVEVICSKAMEKDPADRYARARDLADDLRRFLAHEPIHARPPGPWRRLVKAARRHPVAAACLAGVALLVLLGTGGYLAHLELSNRALAREQQETGRQRDRARANLRGAQAALNKMLENVENLATRPGLEAFHRQMAEDVVGYLDNLVAGEPGEDLALDLLATRARVRLAKTYFWVGQRQDALRQMDLADAAVADVLRRAPGDRKARAYAASNAIARGTILGEADDEAAGAAFDRALAEWRGLVELERDPTLHREYQLGVVEAAVGHARLLANQGRTDGGLQKAGALLADATARLDDVERGLPDPETDYPERSRLRQKVHAIDAWVADGRGDDTAARAAAQAAIDVARVRLAKFPDEPRVRRDLATAVRTRAEFAGADGQRDLAWEGLREAIDLLEGLVRDFPKTASFRVELARTEVTAAGLAGDLDRLDDAQALIDAARKHAEAIGDSWGIDGRRVFGRCLVVWAQVQLVRGGANADFDAVRRALRQAVTLHRELADAQPDSAVLRGDVAFALLQLARCEQRSGNMRLAISTVERAIAEQLRAVEKSPRAPLQQTRLRSELGFHAELLLWEMDHGRTVAASKRMLEHAGDDGKAVLAAATNLANCVYLAQNDQLLSGSERARIVDEYAAAAVAALQRAVALGFRGARRLREARDFQAIRDRPEFAALLQTIDRLKDDQRLKGR